MVEVSSLEASPATVEEKAPEAGNLVGKKVSHYRVLQVLGGGGMGVVYKAEDLKLGRRVAIKFLPAELASDPNAFERLEREARAASALEHPNICPIYELGEHEGQPFIVMQLLEGQSLQERIETAGQQKKPLPTSEMLDLALQIVAGLEAAHTKGIIHRDVKPANIFITNGAEVKILDFGLAKMVEQDVAQNQTPEQAALSGTSVANAPTATFSNLRLTRTGTTVGTAYYMSPEQVQGETLDARTDVFSFGLVLYEMATGERAFPGDTAAVVHDAILHQPPLPIHQLNPGFSVGLEPIVTKALEKDRSRRYQSATDMRADLQRLKLHTESGRSPAASSGTTAAPAPAVRVATLWKIAVPVLLITLLIACGLYYRYHQQRSLLTDKDTIVLADFSNSTGDPVFDDTLRTALTIALRQSPFLNVLSENKVATTLKEMSRPAGTKLTPDVARELCQRARSKAYIAGSIASLGSQYVVGLKAVNCQSGDPLAEEQVTASAKEKVLDVVGEAASKLRGELGESLATVQKYNVPLTEATTSSLEALKAYTLGLKARSEKGPVASLPNYQHAIELDPNFAMATFEVSDDYMELGEPGRGLEYLNKAFQLREHADEWERAIITSAYYGETGQLDKAAQTYQEEIESSSARRKDTLYSGWGVIYAQQGQYEKAAELTREAVRGAPGNLGRLENLAIFDLALQRFDEAQQVVHEAQTQQLDDYILRDDLYILGFFRADSAAMAKQQDWFADRPEQYLGLALASDTEAYAGHLGKARELTNRAMDSAIRADNKEGGAIVLAIAAQREAAFGNPTEAKRAAAEALNLASTSQGVEVEAALAFAMAGDAARAESLAQGLNKRFPLETQMQSLWLPAIRAQLALDRKNPADALNGLQALTPTIELGLIIWTNNTSCLYPTYVRGEAYLAAGQGNAAAAEFQKILDHSGIVWNCWTGALAHLGVARSNALQARTSQGADADAARALALAAYKDFLTLWKDAETEIPILKEAKAEYAKLQ